MGLFAFVKASLGKRVRRPGVRGGRFYFTKPGRLRYGTRPVGQTLAAATEQLHANYGRDLALRTRSDGVAVMRATPDGGMMIAHGKDIPAALAAAAGRLQTLPVGATDLTAVERPRRDRVTLGELRAAVERARRQWPEQPYAGRMEMLLHPHVHAVFRELNPHLDVRRAYNETHGPGMVTDLVSEDAEGEQRQPWNGVREDYFAHSPGSAYSGIYREARTMRFLDDLSSIATGHSQESASLHAAEAVGLRLVRSTALPAGIEVGVRFQRGDGSIVAVEGAEDDALLVRNEQTQRRELLGVSAVTHGQVVRLPPPAPDPVVAAREVVQRLWGTDYDILEQGERSTVTRTTPQGRVTVGEGASLDAALADARQRLSGEAPPALIAKADAPGTERRPTRLLFAAPKTPDGQHQLGMTRAKKPVHASGAESRNYTDEDHHDAAAHHHRAFVHHDTHATRLGEAAEKDDDWKRSETQHEDAERHAKLAEHHGACTREHLIAGGHGGSTTLDGRGDAKFGKIVPHDEEARTTARDALQRRRHWGHPGGLSQADRAAYQARTADK